MIECLFSIRDSICAVEILHTNMTANVESRTEEGSRVQRSEGSCILSSRTCGADPRHKSSNHWQTTWVRILSSCSAVDARWRSIDQHERVYDVDREVMRLRSTSIRLLIRVPAIMLVRA